MKAAGVAAGALVAATQTSLICCIVGNFNNINIIYGIINKRQEPIYLSINNISMCF